MGRVQPNVAARIQAILSLLDRAIAQDDLTGLTGYHQLSGTRRETYAVTVTRDYRVTFRTGIELVTDPDTSEEREEFYVYDVDYEDYH